MPKPLTIEEINQKKPASSRLTAIEFTGKKGKRGRYILVRCSCGIEKEIICNDISGGNTRSCGCLESETTAARNRANAKYHPRNLKIYTCWQAMIRRCHDPRDHKYHFYGGAGVTVCDEWRYDYQAFLDWALANGWAPGLKLDKDKLGTGKLYKPEFCCFITQKDNCQHTKRAKYFEFEGEMQTLHDIAPKVGIPQMILYSRIWRGATFEDAIKTPYYAVKQPA